MIDEVAGKFRALEARLNEEVLGQQVQVNGHVLALIAGVSCFSLGSPGEAKTMLVDRLHAHVDGGDFFSVSVYPATTPEEFFGPMSLQALKQDRFERVTTGTLVTAQWAKIDEVFLASRMLTALHGILAEGTYKHGTDVIRVPLTTLYTMSNELPGRGLDAFWDRLLLRFETPVMLERSVLNKVLRLELAENPAPILSWSDVEAAQKAVRSVEVSDEVIEAALDINSELTGKGLGPSTRRLRQGMRVVQAAALLDGCERADVEHLRVLAHICWDRTEDCSSVDQVVYGIAQPLDNEILELEATVEALAAALEETKTVTDGHEQRKALVEISKKLERTSIARKTLLARAGDNTGRRLRIAKLSERMAPVVEGTVQQFKVRQTRTVAEQVAEP